MSKQKQKSDDHVAKEKISIYVEVELLRLLERLAEKEDRTLSRQIVFLVKQQLKYRPKNFGVVR